MEVRVFHCFFVIVLCFLHGRGDSKHNSINKKELHPSDYNANGNGVTSVGGLFPNVFNLAARAHITANATCGEAGPEVYCKLVEHVQMRAPQCGVCDAHSPDPAKRHPIERAIDGTTSWWQSPSLQNGHQYEWVTITLDLKQVYQVAYVIVKSAISPRPANWILERSVDGSTYLPWQYYAQTDEECWARYGLPPTRGKPSYKSDSDIICTSYFSKLNPLEGGEIHTSLVNGRPGANESKSSLLQFTLARFVRLRLQKIRTLNAEFMSLTRDDDASVTRRLFYSIKDISIGGQCVCSGHAAKCTHSDKHGHPQCECQHNTCGNSCEQCCPLFNQFPWKAGTPQDRAQCEPCECHNHADSCRYDADVAAGKLSVDIHGSYEGGGVCVNCTAHTEGVNCERCEEGWFRPRDVSPRDIEPCRPCNCPTVTSTGCCNSNLNSEVNTDRVCECKPGYSGSNCDNCALGFRHFPRCEPCPCDARGMELMGCEQSCVCKPNVEGQRCDQCKPGYFSLDLDNPEGCTACYCSGVTKVCQEASLHLQNTETMSGWLVSDLPVSRTVVPMVDQETHYLTVRNYEMSGVESYYWLAPEAYQGNHLTSYGSNITFSVSWIVMRGDTSGKPTTGPDIIVVGSNRMRLGHGESSYNQVRNTTITVTLREGDWYHVPDSVKDIVTRLKRKDYRGDKATRAQMMSVLADVRHVLLRAKFHTDQAEGSLQSVSLQTGTYNSSGSLTRHVEHCTCPPGYSGLSCESCKYGYTRVNSSSDHQVEAECRKCDCHGHAPTCDPFTGQCAACEHNTTGSKCGKCSAGFYGDARQGTPSDCHPCACPSFNPEGNFSPTCEQGGHDYICTACPAGYAGDHCERCAGGYYGDPLIQGSTCQSCDCGGGPCNGLTGQCLQCQGNTEGWKCERCIKGHYGDPQQGDCRACRCDPLGSVNSDSCDVESGQCLCRERFRGMTCDRCEVGYGNKTAGCLSCSCHPKGSFSSVCDSVTGECTCKPGVTGPHCDTCQDLHFNLSSTGCQGCGCHQYGSRNSMCDIVSGQCPCKVHVTGRACDYCQDGFWGLSNQGCQQCHCDPVGSNNGSCNTRTGQCPCKQGVGGQRCDICLPGHYRLTTSGCSKCDVCVKTGHICDPDTGRCVCPPHTLGPTCSLCQPNSWGFEPGKGCKPCECNGPGAIHPQCDLVTGRCSCRNGFHGDHCVSCTVGHFGFPRCQQCSCNLPGTMPDNCDTSTGQCSCDDKGQCPCKVNVEGKRCDRCKLGTFGLQADNIDGCTQCFCFGRTTACTQAGLIWSQILAGPSRTLYLEYKRDKPRYKPGHKDVAYIQLLVPGSGEQNFKGDNARLNSTNNLLLVPGTAGDVRIGANHLLDKPLYWQLPSQFLGDKILSYGGYLQFTLENEDGANPAPKHVLSSQPLIQIQGNSRIILEHYPILPNPLGRYKVRFHESLWRLKTDKKGKVSREVFMLALQNIQHVFIRTSEYLDYTKVVLRDAAMDTAVSTPGQPYPLARGVELCECPRQYNSSSCQDPSIGFYRYYDNNSITSTIVIQLLGEARPCECNNRSKVCDIETGHCLNCTANTGGPHCERCGEGYYGDPIKGSCQPCPCPFPGRNFARSCHVAPHRITCRCREGYTGQFCDSCSYGWFGYPKRPGGFCQPCECNRHGSVSDECDEETGQCNCKPGIASRDCSECTGRTVLTDRGCSSCDDECTGVLLNDLDNLAALLKKKGGHLSGGITPPPWGLLRSVEGNTSQLAMRLDQLHQLNNRVVALPTNLGEDIRRDIKQLLRRSEGLGRRSDSIAQDGAFLKEETSKILAGMEKIENEIKDTTRSLDDYGQGDRGMLSISAALKEAQHLLASIKSHNLEPRRSAANKTLWKVEHQLKYLQSLVDNLSIVGPDKQRLADLINRINDLNNILKNVITNINKAKDITENNRGRMGQAKVYIDQSKRLQGEIATLSEEGVNLNDKAHQLLEETELYINDSRNSLIELHNLTWSVEKLEGILYRLNPLYLDKYVIPAQKHVDILLRRVLNYTELFNPTRHNATVALRASKAYQDIVDALDEALSAAMNARNAGEQAYKTAHPDNDDNILDKSLVSLANSDRLLVRAKQKQDDVAKLSKELDNQRKSIRDDQEILRNAAVKDNIISRELSQLERKENSSREMLEESLLAASNASGTSATVYKKATDIINKVEMNLRPQLANLDYQLQLDIIEHNITQGLKNVRQSDELLTKLTEEAEERNKKFQLLNATLADKLQELRNKIMQARHAANGIHVSIKSQREEDGAGCIRSYHPSNLEPSTTTSITLNYAIESDQRNGVLLYLPSGTSDDFVAIEMVDRRIRFVWDVGHGSGTVEHPLQIKSGQLLSDIHWYKIQVDRTSNIAKLTVRPQIEPESPSQANGTSDAGFGQLDVGPGDTLWVGGIPPSIRKPQRLQSTDVQGLIGCLYQILFNGRPIGLWNFSNETYKGGCVACIQGAEERKDELSYHFTGDGYSSLRRGSSSPHNKYVFSVSFKFRTLDENALIFLAVDPLKMGFVSLTLSEGRVMFNIGYGGDLYLEILTPEKHNHGNWTIVEASRYFDRKSKKEKCVLKVEGESQDGEPNKQPSLSAIPDLSSAFYFVGGVPPGFSSGPNKLQVLNSYLGCLADIQVNQEGYNPLHGQFYGVEAACTFEPEVVSFQGDGYLHLASHTLKKRAAFGLSFRTLQQNTLLFLSTFEGIRPTLPQDVTEGYYSVSLSEGTLRVWANAGRGDTFLNSTNSYNDGQFHALVVTKNGRKLQLRVDDQLEGTTTLPEGATALKAPGDIGGLYLGGLPPGLNAVNMVASVVPLFGTIKDVIFNEKILQFNNPVSFDHAGIGRLGDLPAQMVSRSASAPSPPMKVEAARCHEVASNVTEPGAVKFGDSPNSHVLIHRRTAVDKKEYILELDFRTFYPNGLLFIITSTRGKNRHYLMAALRDKQLHVTVKWRRKLPVILSPALNDGMWHHVTLTKINRQLQVEVDSHPAETSKGKFPKKLNMGNIMYVGGLPQNIRALPDNLVSKHEGFKGCMRNLAINKQSQDLVGAKTTPNKVGQCFPQVERGSYFPGDAYAIYKNMFRVGIVLELELEFRTSELSGILLSVSEPQGYPALSLELNDGKVIMTGDIGDRRPLRVEQGFPSPYTLCNNKWHSIKAIFDKDELTLKVDHLNTTYGHSGNGHFDEASTNSPLYIGGLPDNAPTGTLETRDNFKGCIRNMVIGRQHKDWTDMATLHNILLNSCPSGSH